MPDIKTQADYNAYCRDVADFFEREGLETFSAIPPDDGEDYPEPYFSWRPCECCGCPLGGDREDYHGFSPKTGEIQGPYSVCVDCVYFTTYGRLDDMTMARIEDPAA